MTKYLKIISQIDFKFGHSIAFSFGESSKGFEISW